MWYVFRGWEQAEQAGSLAHAMAAPYPSPDCGLEAFGKRKTGKYLRPLEPELGAPAGPEGFVLCQEADNCVSGKWARPGAFEIYPFA